MYSIQEKSLWYDNKIFASRVGEKLELATNTGLTVGYYSSLQAGLSIRLGEIHSPFWTDYGPIHNHITRPAVIPDARIQWKPNFLLPMTNEQPSQAPEKRTKSREIYGFVGVGVDVVMYNALLQGQFRRNDYEIEASDVARVIPHITAGGVMDFGKWQFSIAHNWKGPEIKDGKDHRWTSFSVKYFY